MISPLYMSELEEIAQVTGEFQQRFQITDLSSLTWAMRKLTAIEVKRSEVTQVANSEIERIESYRKRELEGLQQSEDFFKGLISEYAVRKRDADPRFRNEKTAYGSIRFRKQQPNWIYDEESLISFLEQNERTDLVRVKKEPAKTEIKKLFQINEDGRVFDEYGQEVTGVKVEFLPDVLTIKPEV
ncbi:host-nuclease inhibitor Gam family protein [Paenibacillus cremeus]|uniref:Uncharacterized protein n=1 Tax=Paenibacillus cremeus TaxID=2163881 RepID=A0A559K4W6_9BACL|nr:host-nuclease inhibitor Gam family protein [Paenibacillus cremeus]TVY07189.1 hypothetical protein FPZ49_25095 [Paenibacillus cremeus]